MDKDRGIRFVSREHSGCVLNNGLEKVWRGAYCSKIYNKIRCIQVRFNVIVRSPEVDFCWVKWNLLWKFVARLLFFFYIVEYFWYTVWGWITALRYWNSRESSCKMYWNLKTTLLYLSSKHILSTRPIFTYILRKNCKAKVSHHSRMYVYPFSFLEKDNFLPIQVLMYWITHHLVKSLFQLFPCLSQCMSRNINGRSSSNPCSSTNSYCRL